MSYGSDTHFGAWLDAQGISLMSAVPLPILRARGSSWIDAEYGGRFIGRRATFEQESEWPRIGAVTTSGQAVADDAIPAAVVVASYRAAVAEASGVNLSRVFDPVTAGAQVKREKVDVIETEYFAPPTTAAHAAPVVAGVDGLLAPFLRDANATRTVFFGRV